VRQGRNELILASIQLLQALIELEQTRFVHLLPCDIDRHSTEGC
jgi:hypothetical protein